MVYTLSGVKNENVALEFQPGNFSIVGPLRWNKAKYYGDDVQSPPLTPQVLEVA